MNFYLRLAARTFFIFCGFVLILGFLGGGLEWFSGNMGEFFKWKISRDKTDLTAGISQAAPLRNWQMETPEINAESAIAAETNLSSADKILFNKNEERILPVASITKLMTAVVALENYKLSDKITITRDAVAQTGAQGSLKLGDQMSVKDLLFVMLIESSNHAAYALSDAMGEKRFVFLMNEKAKSLGLENTSFADPTGLGQNYSTSKDLSKLIEYLIKNYSIITEISRTKEMDLYRLDGTYYGKLVNTNQLLGEIPEIVGGKTGFTTDAKGCLVLAVKNSQDNDYLIYVVLGSEDRFGEMKKIINWVGEAYKWQ